MSSSLSCGSNELLMAVDIGTGSVRVAFFDQHGKLLGLDVTSIGVYRSASCSDIYEQSTDEIWDAITRSAKSALDKAKLAVHLADGFTIAGVCFDATCSLAFADSSGNSLPLTTQDGSKFIHNIIMWLDHRAGKETNSINSTKHVALLSYGGGLSIEMEPPKLLWVKNNCTESWKKVGVTLDLADFITYKLTKLADVRSTCTMACKWAYDSLHQNCRQDFWELVGMPDVYDKFLSKSNVIAPAINIQGEAYSVLKGLDLPVSEAVGVSAGVIDAYAGALGCLATRICLDTLPVKASEMGTIICGTSTCLFLFVENSTNPPPSVTGIWGPFWNVLGNNLWAYESGQSASGKLLDWLFEFHPAGQQFAPENRSTVLQQHLTTMAKEKKLDSFHFLTKDVHVCPDFHGNRSPLARPDMRGMLIGLDLDTSVDSLAILYLATIQALAYNVRYMLEMLASFGVQLPKVMVACGGLSRDSLYLQTHADVLAMPFAVPQCSEVMLLGCAILASTARGFYASVDEASAKMGSDCALLLRPGDEKIAQFHDKKYKVYHKLLTDQLEILSIMEN